MLQLPYLGDTSSSPALQQHNVGHAIESVEVHAHPDTAVDTQLCECRTDVLSAKRMIIVSVAHTGLASGGLVQRQEMVGICGFSSLDWVCVLFANTYLGAFSPPPVP